MYNEKPANALMQPHRLAFIEARRVDLASLESGELNIAQIEILFRDWISFCDPYGFGYLREFSEKGLAEISDHGQVSRSLLTEILTYLNYHEKNIALSQEY